jgi:hypothetical protein
MSKAFFKKSAHPFHGSAEKFGANRLGKSAPGRSVLCKFRELDEPRGALPA